MAWNTAVIFFYGVPVAGREAKAFETFNDAATFFGKLAADGKCAEPEMFHYGFGGGMMIVRAASIEDLFEMLERDESRKIIAAATYTVTDFRYEIFFTGERMMENMGNWAQVGAELGYF
jgi:hypothetical protein